MELIDDLLLQCAHYSGCGCLDKNLLTNFLMQLPVSGRRREWTSMPMETQLVVFLVDLNN